MGRHSFARRGDARAAPEPLGRSFWVVWWAATASFLGDGVFYGALPLLAASLTRDPRLISLTDALEMLGWLLLGLVSGVLVDRWRRTSVMWRVDAVRAVITAAFAALVIAGQSSIGLVLTVSFVLGLAAPFFDNASTAVLPELVPSDALERANSWSQTSMLLCANLVGPPVGAVLFVLMPGLPLAIQAASFVAAAALVAHVRRAGGARDRTESRSVRVELVEGMRYLWRHRLLRSLCLLLAVINGVTGGVVAILVLYVLEVLRLPETAYGWLIAVFAVGGLVGASLASQARRTLGLQGTVVGSSVVFGVGIVVMGVWPDLAVVVIMLLLVGVASVLWNIVTVSLRQRIVPARLLGRVTSVYRMVGFAAMPLGAVGAGALAHATNLQTTYVVSGAVLLVATAVAAPAIRSGIAEQSRVAALHVGGSDA